MRRVRNQFVIATAVALLVLLGAGTAVADAKAVPASPIDLNEASVDQLTELPGVGKVTAGRIVEWRDEHGPFRRVEDLMKVKGIGEKSFEKLLPSITVGEAGA